MAAPTAQYAVNSPVVLQGMPTVASAVIQPFSGRLKARQQKAMTVLSALQCTSGLSCIIINIVLISLMRRSFNTDFVGSGIWCGALFLTAGILGLVAAKKNSAGLMISTMIMSIISCSVLTCAIAMSSIGLAGSPGSGCREYYYGYSYNCIRLTYSQATVSGYLAADSLTIVFAITEFVVALWTSVLCCKGVCSSCCLPYPNGYNAQPVFYSAGQAGGQQVVLPYSGFAGRQQIVMLASQQFQPTGQLLFTQPLPPYSFQAESAPEMQGAQPPAYERGLAQANPGHTVDGGDMCKQPTPV